LISKPHEDKLGNMSLAAIVNALAIYLLSRENSAATSKFDIRTIGCCSD
jgi:hypothetical protein